MYLDVLVLTESRAMFSRALELAQQSGSRYFVRFSSAGAALTCLEQGDELQAEAVLAGLIDRSRAPRTWAERCVWFAYAQLSQARGDHATALRLIEEMIASDPQAGGGRPIRRFEHLRGRALGELGRFAEAPAALECALRDATERGARPRMWRIEADLGWLQLKAGRRREAGLAFSAARAIVDQLLPDMPPDLRPRFLSGVSESLPQEREPTPRQVAKEASGGLTARERDVAVLVSRGMSNREIAEALVLGERTVQTHVGHILNKLCFSTRAQIAAWAAERGLATSQENAG
jgi:DNA-binding CsgD family transcriptional regulator